ncbi:MAG: hypothetical protein JXR77_10440, partial [Lentisphaeria bacterium]|nr:hypothetical protein [Lentisphaeria bacterium]
TYAVAATVDDPNWAGTATGDLVVAPAPLTCTADDQERLFWTTNPVFTITYAGLVNGDIAPEVPPVASSWAVQDSPPGTYAITLAGGGDPNYAITLVDGILTVLPAVEVAPVGDFELAFVDPGNPARRRIWDFRGPYEAVVQGYTLELDLDHDPKGALTGTGRLAGIMPSGTPVDVPLTVKGKVSGKSGAVAASISLSGKTATSTVKLKLALSLGGDTLVGACSGRVADGLGGTDKLADGCVLALDAAMNGEFQLGMGLEQNEKGAITGTGVLTLANGREVPVLIKGKESKGVLALQVVGDKALDPLAGAVKLKLAVRTLSNGAAEAQTLQGKAFGQRLAWPE